MDQTKERVRDFLVEEAHWDGAREELADDLPLIEEGILDSMLLLRMVAWIEEALGVAVADTEIIPANFGSIERIGMLVDEKRGRAGA